MTPNQLLCFGCMHELTTPGQTCPHCGHDNRIRHNGPGLLAETLLGGQYQVGRVLGRGGFGVTYIGYDLNLTQRIAIKEYFPASLVTRSKDDLTLSAITGSEESYRKGLERALKESRMAASLRRIPGVVQVYNVLPANNTMYIIMEYVEGRTLTRYVEEAPALLTPAQAEKLLAPVADALARLHKMDVIHRDVKPDNIMIRREDDEGVLLDFGAARSVDARTFHNSSAIVSTGYAPVEQYNLSTLDGRIDQYALAATLMFTLTGKAPPDVMQRLAMPETTPVLHTLNPSVSPAVEKAVLRGMALKANERYPDVQTFWEAFCGKGSAAAKADRSGGRGAGKIVAAAAGVVLVGGLLYFAIPGIRAAFAPIAATVPAGDPAGEAATEPAAVPAGDPADGAATEPTAVPAEATAGEATAEPTAAPAETPAGEAATEPAAVPTATPAIAPTATHTAAPTATPTAAPTATPTAVPTATPKPTATPLPAPAACSLRPLTHGVEITIPAYTAMPEIVLYRLYRVQNGETVPVEEIRAVKRMQYVDKKLLSGVTADYYVVAVQKDGTESPAGEPASILWEAPAPKPTATPLPGPAACTLRPLTHGVEITIPAYTLMPEIVLYRLYRVQNGETVPVKEFRAIKRMQYVDKELLSGVTATYYAVAVQKDGTESPMGETASILWEAPAPKPTATPLPGPACTLRPLTNGVEITIPAYTLMPDITQYRLYRVQNGETVLVKEIRAVKRMQYVDKELASGVAADYYVVAVQKDGTESPMGETASIVWEAAGGR